MGRAALKKLDDDDWWHS